MFQKLIKLKNREVNSMLMDLRYLHFHPKSHIHLETAFKFSVKVFKKLQHQRTYKREIYSLYILLICRLCHGCDYKTQTFPSAQVLSQSVPL